jgi:hypothetical protein
MPRSAGAVVSDPQAQSLANTVAALRACANRFGREPGTRKAMLLRQCAAHALADPDTLLSYHDCLLFLLAYPESSALHAAARRELIRVADAARAMIDSGSVRTRARLANTGVAWAPMTIAFGYDIARWLADSHPQHGDIDSFDEAGTSLAALLRQALPEMEFELLADDDAAAEDLLAQASAGRRSSALVWLVAQFARLPCAEGLREQLFDSLKTYITINPGASALSRTFVRGLPEKTFFHHDELRRVVDPPALIAQALAPAPALGRAERRHLLDAGRAMLASMGRETDAIAAAKPEGIEYHVLGRGVAIALYTMAAGRRLPLDSHVGFMLFKNSVPIGYGGGWPFLGSAKIGVNIFAPFRGGESAYLFCQVLRVYSQRFGVSHFIAEPSQFGGGNREGLESGAFWFYYRLGFRPVAPALAALAAAESARMRREPGYRPDIAVLRRFTKSDIELRLPGPSERVACDPAELSLAVSADVASRFQGDRARAMAFAVKSVSRALGVRGIARWPEAERAAFRSYCLLLARIPDLARWPARDKARVVALARAKGGDEFRYYDLLRSHTRLQTALCAIAGADA